MKQLCTILLIAVISVPSFSQYYSSSWIRVAGSISSGYSRGRSLAFTESNDVLMTGTYYDTLVVKSANDSIAFIAQQSDAIVQKYLSNGDLAWTKVYGGKDYVYPNSIKVDSEGNILIVGTYEDTIDFDPDTSQYIASCRGESDIYVQKLDSNGNFMWAKTFGGTSYDYVSDLSLDNQDNIYVTGSFYGSVDFDTATVNGLRNSNGVSDIYVLKMSSDGNFKWVKTIGSTSFEAVSKMHMVEGRHLYVCGTFSNTCDFNPGAGVNSLTSNGQWDAFVLKLDTGGAYTWAKSFGSASKEMAEEMAVDVNGDVILGGNFSRKLDFDPSPTGVFELTTKFSDGDIFLLKLDSLGIFKWVRQLEISNRGHLELGDIAVDSEANIILIGDYDGTVDLDPDSSEFKLSGIGTNEIFVSMLDSTGSFLWGKAIRGHGNDFGGSIGIDSNDSIYFCAVYQEPKDLDPGNGVYIPDPIYRAGAFLQKLGPCSPVFVTDSITACESYTWVNGVTYPIDISDVRFVYQQSAVNGCDSIVKLYLDIIEPKKGMDSITACSSYTWIDGITYTSNTKSPEFTLIGAGSNGCDSIVSLNLTIQNSQIGKDHIAACNSYIWIDGVTYTSSNNSATHTLVNGASNGCDSIVELELVISNSQFTRDSIFSCQPYYTWINGITYTKSDSASITLSSAQGCDSLVTLDLTLIDVDTSVSLLGQTIVAHANKAHFTWGKCENGYFSKYSADTLNSFTPVQNGSYAVIISQYGCSDTSRCVSINDIGLRDCIKQDEIGIYPNPTKGKVTIDVPQEYIWSGVLIFNSSGKLVFEKNTNNNVLHEIDLSNLARGLYTLEVILSEQSLFYKIIVQ